jgi:two-component system phosphate regulon sensor histidine kinase PhoR
MAAISIARVKRSWWRRNADANRLLEPCEVDADARRARTLIEESREAVVVLDERDVVLAASRRARQSVDDIYEGRPLPPGLLSGDLGIIPLVVPYDVDGRTERLVYLSRAGDLTAYEELRAGFTAAVSHELRTPLARLLALLETAALPGEDVGLLVEQARSEVDQIRELIDEVLFLSELESGARVVSLGAVSVLPELEAVIQDLQERADRAGVSLVAEGDPEVQLEIRPRMLRVIAQNLAENAVRYAGPGAHFTLRVERTAESVVISGVDDGVGVSEADLGRLFERFYRSDRARASRGTGLGLAIVKHVVTQAGGAVEARGGRGAGLEIRCTFPARPAQGRGVSPFTGS